MSNIIVYNILYTTSLAVVLSTSAIVLIKGFKKPLNFYYFTVGIFVCVFLFAYLYSANAQSAYIPYLLLMFNYIGDILLSVAFVSWCRSHTVRPSFFYSDLIYVYFIAISLILAYIAKPSLYVLPPEPTQYLNYSLTPGPLYPLMLVFFGICIVHGVSFLVSQYYKSESKDERNRLKYAILGSVIGYGFGSLTFLPEYGFNIDISLGAFVFLYSIIISYAIVKHKVMDINLVIKKTFMYALAITIMALFASTITFANNWLTSKYEWINSWMVSFFAGIIIFILFYISLKQLSSIERSEHELKTILAHKFRTPLTRLRHGLDLIRETSKKDSMTDTSRNILISNAERDTKELIELTALMLDYDNTKETTVLRTKTDIVKLVKEVILNKDKQAADKKISIRITSATSGSSVLVNVEKVKSIFEMVLDNAITYSYSNTIINVWFKNTKSNKYIDIFVQNDGIKISNKEKKIVFNKFYRCSNAKKIHTEGTGLGLYLSKRIIKSHGGNMWFEKKDEPLTTVVLRFPLSNNEK